jgi:hypothetical protein
MKPTYEYSPVTEEQKVILEAFNDVFSKIDADIKKLVPAGRYQSLALTHLETAAMFASKGISKQGD